MDISMDIHGKSVDKDMDMNGKFHIHGKPGRAVISPERSGAEPQPRSNLVHLSLKISHLVEKF